MNEKEGRNGDDKIRIPREFFSFNRRISQDHDGYLKSGILFAINSRVNPIRFSFFFLRFLRKQASIRTSLLFKKKQTSNVKRVFKDFFIKLSPGEYQTVAYHHPLFSPEQSSSDIQFDPLPSKSRIGQTFIYASLFQLR